MVRCINRRTDNRYGIVVISYVWKPHGPIVNLMHITDNVWTDRYITLFKGGLVVNKLTMISALNFDI